MSLFASVSALEACIFEGFNMFSNLVVLKFAELIVRFFW